MQVRRFIKELSIIIIAFIVILNGAKCQAGTYYVATNGSDTDSGTSTTSPWLTIQHAANVVPAGSTVYVMGGVYAPFTVNVSGSASAGYTTFTNYAGQNAIIDGTGFTGSYDYGLIHILDQSWITISGFEIRNGSSTTTSFGGYRILAVKGEAMLLLPPAHFGSQFKVLLLEARILDDDVVVFNRQTHS
jgi:hypothetical protein